MFDFFENKKKKAIFTISLIVIAILMVIIIFYDKFDSFFAKISEIISVLNSIFVGIVIAYILNPLERFFSRHILKKMKTGKWHKFLSILLTYLMVIGFVTVFLLITIPQLAKSVSELPPKLESFIDSMSVTFQGWITAIEASDFYKSIVESVGAENFNIRNMFDGFISTFINIEEILTQVAGSAVSLVGSIYSFAANLLIGFVLSIYLLSAKSRLTAQGKMLTTAIFGEKKAKSFFGILKFSDRTFGSFIQGKIINSTLTGIISGIVLAIFGLPYPQLLAVIIAVTDIIPVFGPFIGGIPCAFLVLIAAPEKLLLFIILIVVIQQFDGNYIAPKILGESTGLSALGVFIAILVMGGYFGLIGMIIGVPLFAVIFALLKNSVEKKLALRGLSSDIVDYYYKHSDDLQAEEHKSFFKKVVDFCIDLVKKLIAFVKKIFTGKSDGEASPKETKKQNDKKIKSKKK